MVFSACHSPEAFLQAVRSPAAVGTELGMDSLTLEDQMELLDSPERAPAGDPVDEFDLAGEMRCIVRPN